MRINKLIGVPLILLLASCYEPPDYKVLETNFQKNETIFLEVKRMIEEDVSVGYCNAVSDDHIFGWWEHDGLWNTNQNYDHKVKLPVVLSAVGISSLRYADYLRKLESIGALQGVSHCNKLDTKRIGVVTSTRFGMDSSGIGVSGCTTDIVHRGTKEIPASEEHPSFFYVRIPINKDWYIEHGCT